MSAVFGLRDFRCCWGCVGTCVQGGPWWCWQVELQQIENHCTQLFVYWLINFRPSCPGMQCLCFAGALAFRSSRNDFILGYSLPHIDIFFKRYWFRFIVRLCLFVCLTYLFIHCEHPVSSFN